MEGLELSGEQQGEAAVLPGGSPGFSQHLAHPTGRVKNNCSGRGPSLERQGAGQFCEPSVVGSRMSATLKHARVGD